jgi:hypothetical protein
VFLTSIVDPYVKQQAEAKYTEVQNLFLASLVPGHERHFFPQVNASDAATMLARPLALHIRRQIAALADALGNESEVRVIDWHCHLDKARRAALNLVVKAAGLTDMAEMQAVVEDAIDDSPFYSAFSTLAHTVHTLSQFKMGVDTAAGADADKLPEALNADNMVLEADLFVKSKARQVAERSNAVINNVARILQGVLPESDLKREYFQWVVKTPDKEQK